MYQKTPRSTMHGINTPHGYGTPHRLPNSGRNFSQMFDDLVRQLYPTGRAWYLKRGGVFFLFHKAISRSYIRLIQDGLLTIESIFPDNENFTGADATLWEYRLGLITNTALTLDVRKQAILRKMAYPNNVKARQNPNYIEFQLRLAGFDVYVHENRFFEGGEWVYRSPEEIVATGSGSTQHGPPTQHGGGTQHGSTNFDVIANQMYPNESYSVGSGNLWATFFIGGENLGDVADVPTTRLPEFKQLVLKLKPAHTVAFIFINFT